MSPDHSTTSVQKSNCYQGHSDLTRNTGPAKFFFWPGHALYIGTVEDTSQHAHHALQVVIGMSKSFVLETPGRNYELRAAVIAADQAHRFRGRGDKQVIILLDNESAAAQNVQAASGKGSSVVEVDIKILQPFIEELRAFGGEFPDIEKIRVLSHRMLSALAGQPPRPTTPDSRIQAALAFMKGQEDLKAALGQVAEAVGLSEGRLTHLFREQVGIPMRRYLLWLRLLRAVGNLCDGASLTAAAHNAGFADSAHFSRTFRRMFGITPSGLFKNSRFVQVIASTDW